MFTLSLSRCRYVPYHQLNRQIDCLDLMFHNHFIIYKCSKFIELANTRQAKKVYRKKQGIFFLFKDQCALMTSSF